MIHSKALTRIEQAGEITPLCPHFGPCGGCQLQHLPYPAQLALKQQRLADLLSFTSIPAIQTHAASPWIYRNRIRLRVEPADANTFALGYNQQASSTFLPISVCPISAPLLLRTAQHLVALASQNLTIARWLSATAEVELFTTPDESHLQLTLFLRAAPLLATEQVPRTFADLCESLRQQVPQLSGAGAELLRSTHANAPRPRVSRCSASAFTPPSWGSSGLRYPVTFNGIPQQLWVSRGSFFQVNRYLLESLVATAISPQQTPFPLAATAHPAAPAAGDPLQSLTVAASPPSTQSLAWDLFAGVGLFTRALAPHVTHLVAVESSASSTADLAAARLLNLRIHTSTVLDFLRVAALDRDRPALVLLDPPRAGLGLEAATLLARVRPARIVYVSCEPVTLARDLAAMLSSGYNLAELHLVDMFPQTSHQETVAILHRIEDRTAHQTQPVQG